MAFLDFVDDADTPEMRELSRSARRFAESKLNLPQGTEPKFRRENFQEMGSLGFSGAALSENCGGSALSPEEIAALTFELARIQLGPAIYLSVHCMVSRLIETWGAKDQFQSELNALASGTSLGAFCLTEANAGSDSAALRTQATKSGDKYILQGEKIYITSGGVADLYLVFARTSQDPKKGISAFIVPKGTPGLSFGKPEKKMGCEGSPITSVTFDKCEISEMNRIGAEGDGHKISLSGLAGGRVNIAACACALASRAIELATAFAKQRQQFGQTIAEFQGLQFMLADMVTSLRASILMTRGAASALKHNPRENLSASMAKCFATDRAMEITTNAVQIFGGAGYLADYEVERLMRDAKMLQIVEGTNQIQRVVIAKEILK